MTRRFLTDEGKAALRKAVEDVEAQSAAELIIAVRARSASYLHADVLMAGVAAFATLAFLLFSDYVFALHWIAVDPLLVGTVVGLLTSRLPGLRRVLTPSAVRMRWVIRAARAAFVEHGTHHTKSGTGILLYISVLEKQTLLIGDRVIDSLVPAGELRKANEELQRALAESEDAGALAAAVGPLKTLLESYVPREENDVNELPDVVRAP